MVTAEYDMTGLSRFVSELSGAVFGNGQDGDIHRILKTESGQLAWDISQALGPGSKDEGDTKAMRDVKGFLTTLPAYSNLDEEQQYSHYGDFTWLQAGPAFLVGINDEDNQPTASGEDALIYLRAGQKQGSRGKAYIDLGTRGRQHIKRLNRTRVSSSAFRYVARSIQDKVGTLRASFAFAAAQLIPGKRIPAWISRHFATKANGRAIFNDAGLNGENPFLEFGSSAPGVESNSKITEAIAGQIEKRKRILQAKIKKVLRGYAYDWNTGRVFHRNEAKEDADGLG